LLAAGPVGILAGIPVPDRPSICARSRQFVDGLRRSRSEQRGESCLERVVVFGSDGGQQVDMTGVDLSRQQGGGNRG
jgi:hypothetical protein